MNAIMGKTRPGDMGFDVVHLNLHKTFSTPHGGGGPGSGPVGVKKELVPFLPGPVVERVEDRYYLDDNRPLSIGRVKSFYGNFGVVVKAFAYIRSLGAAGLREASETAVLNANYIRARLQDDYELPFGKICMHEVVFSAQKQSKFGVSALDIAKRLIDFGYHPPTIYFPLIVKEALMIEPTETESKETLDEFIVAMQQIASEAQTNPELLKEAPHDSMVKRLDEVAAVRKPMLRYNKV
jgi:Glycine cleavage system protein P (pyridoxal-binding), C-terminal domain